MKPRAPLLAISSWFACSTCSQFMLEIGITSRLSENVAANHVESHLNIFQSRMDAAMLIASTICRTKVWCHLASHGTFLPFNLSIQEHGVVVDQQLRRDNKNLRVVGALEGNVLEPATATAHTSVTSVCISLPSNSLPLRLCEILLCDIALHLRNDEPPDLFRVDMRLGALRALDGTYVPCVDAGDCKKYKWHCEVLCAIDTSHMFGQCFQFTLESIHF